MNVIDFEDFKQQYVNRNIPLLFAGVLDVDITQIMWNMNSDECEEFKEAAASLYIYENKEPMDKLLEKLAIEYLTSEAQDEYKNMIARYEDERGEDEAFYQMNR